MTADSDALRALNDEMMQAESAGDTAYFEALLAPQFAMRRADLTTFVDRAGFLSGVKESPARTTEDFEILLSTATLAVVRCTIAMTRDGELRRFNNVRVFARAAAATPWKLLSWANES